MTFGLTVNGVRREVDAPPATTLIDVLRDDLGLTGAKVGCGIGFCGACTVHLDGRPVHACCVVAGDCTDAEITTVEQTAQTPLGRQVVSAVAAHGAVQCGFCTPGFVMSAVGLLTENPQPTRAEVNEYLVGNICRCTGFAKLVGAVCAVADQSAAGCGGRP